MLTSDGNRLDGCDFGSIEAGDYRLEFGQQDLPTKVDLRQYCSPVEDQGRIGSCTANACVGALEYAYTRRDGHSTELSRLFVYYNTRRLKGMTEQDSGAAINEAMAAVMAFGACESKFWPYDINNYIKEPPQQAYENGKLHEAIQYARVPGPDGAMLALANNYPVVFGTFLPQRLYEEAGKTGLMPPSEPAELVSQPASGHCMLIVGYDSTAGHFIVRNSWGKEWGNDGYCKIPFKEMALFSPPDTFWIILELEPKGNFSLVKPVPQSAPATPAPISNGNPDSLRSQLDQSRREIQSDVADLRASLGSGSMDRITKTPQGYGASCFTCGGSGSCFFCGGRGINVSADSNCLKCFGYGRCNSCGGKGYT